MNTASVSVVVSESGRRYVWAKEIGEICGVSELSLDTKYRPIRWATPRDFKWTGTAMLIAEESLMSLADSFQAHGLPDQSQRLRDFLTAHLVRVHQEQQAAPGGPHRPAVACTPQEPVGWARKWEADHDA